MTIFCRVLVGWCLFFLASTTRFQSCESWILLPSVIRRQHQHRQHQQVVSSSSSLRHHRSDEDRYSELNKDASTKENNLKELSSSLSSLPSRREWFSKIAKTAAASALAVSSSASFSPAATAVNVITSSAVCDASVSVWELPAASIGGGAATTATNNGRLVYLLGTAHISEVSAQLAGQLVRDTHPNAVFVELDLKRVGGISSQQALAKSRATTNRIDIDMNQEASGGEGGVSSRIVIPRLYGTSAVVPAVAQQEGDTTMVVASSSSSSSTATTTAPADPPSRAPITPPQPRFGFFRQGVLNVGAAAVGNAIRSMYKNLGDAGFKPGDEFAMAIQAGRDIGADVVLGDQDVEITLRRLTQALAVTDLEKLMDPDSDLERSMRELMGAPEGRSDPMALAGVEGKTEEFKQELSSYVEVIKTRESVRRIMAQLNQVAPALVQVMLTERDAYMAAGLDTLNQYEVITAVMGVAHQDGVEANLRQRGWKQVSLAKACRKLRR